MAVIMAKPTNSTFGANFHGGQHLSAALQAKVRQGMGCETPLEVPEPRNSGNRTGALPGRSGVEKPDHRSKLHLLNSSSKDVCPKAPGLAPVVSVDVRPPRLSLSGPPSGPQNPVEPLESWFLHPANAWEGIVGGIESALTLLGISESEATSPSTDSPKVSHSRKDKQRTSSSPDCIPLRPSPQPSARAQLLRRRSTNTVAPPVHWAHGRVHAAPMAADHIHDFRVRTDKEKFNSLLEKAMDNGAEEALHHRVYHGSRHWHKLTADEKADEHGQLFYVRFRAAQEPRVFINGVESRGHQESCRCDSCVRQEALAADKLMLKRLEKTIAEIERRQANFSEESPRSY